ncbi:MAG TPA: hypothetical protein VEA41_02790 [Salinarimonas sp.]|nr:hypothetical protein [Salinarimonas sp.]
MSADKPCASDSFLPDPPSRGEDKARIALALKVARTEHASADRLFEQAFDHSAALCAMSALATIIRILDNGE